MFRILIATFYSLGSDGSSAAPKACSVHSLVVEFATEEEADLAAARVGSTTHSMATKLY